MYSNVVKSFNVPTTVYGRKAKRFQCSHESRAKRFQSSNESKAIRFQCSHESKAIRFQCSHESKAISSVGFHCYSDDKA